MMLDFGVDPRSAETMSLAQYEEMLRGLAARRQKDKLPTKAEEEKAMSEFAKIVEGDAAVVLH